MKKLFIVLIPCGLMLLLGCVAQQGPGFYGNKGLWAQRTYPQTIEVLVDVPIVTVKLKPAGMGWKIDITNHANDPIKFLIDESSYESPSGVSSSLLRGEGSASKTQAPVTIPADTKHRDYLVCEGQVSQEPGQIAKLKLVFELNGERKTWVAAIRSVSMRRMK